MESSNRSRGENEIQDKTSTIHLQDQIQMKLSKVDKESPDFSNQYSNLRSIEQVSLKSKPLQSRTLNHFFDRQTEFEKVKKDV